MAVDYNKIYEQMNIGEWYTASQLGVAAASMTAMCNRGMVEKTATTPRKYRKIDNCKYSTIAATIASYGSEYFTAFKNGSPIGMLCSIKGNRIVDCWDKPYDVSDVEKIMVNKNTYISL